MTDKPITYADSTFASATAEAKMPENAPAPDPLVDQGTATAPSKPQAKPNSDAPKDKEVENDVASKTKPDPALKPVAPPSLPPLHRTGDDAGLGRRIALVSMVGLAAVVGLAYWQINSGKPTAKRVEARKPTPPKIDRSIAAKKAAAVKAAAIKAKRQYPRVNQAVLASLGDFEYRITPKKHYRFVRIEKGDTFMRLLLRNGVGRKEAYRALTTMGGIFDPRRIRPGRRMGVAFGVLGQQQGRFLGVKFDSSYDKIVSIERQPDGAFIAAEIKKELSTALVRGDGTIKSSLFQAGLRAGVPASPMIRLIHLFSFDVDFQRDIRKGNKFQILYKQHRESNGQIVKNGEIVYAALTLQGTTLRLYRYKTSEGKRDFFNENGKGTKKALMRTPINGARLSSGFGYRRHPILGYSKLHRGTDFAAPRGTRIYAAGDGVIEKMGWYGGYGRYIRIRHNKRYSTAYAHMTRFGKGMRVGRRVEQGQTIGHVGTTGRSTGPHLHYEVLFKGKQINSQALKLPSKQSLEGAELKRFLAYRREIDQRFAALKKNGGAKKLLMVRSGELNGCVNGVRLDPTDKRAC